MNNPLDAVMAWYQVAYDSMRVTRRVVTKGAKDIVIERHVFFGLPVRESTDKLRDSIGELQNVAVLALVAVFERTLRQHVTSKVRGALPTGDPVADRVWQELEADVEYWHFTERLIDVFETVPAQVRGNVKQLVEFRNWVAHGHFVASPAPMKAEPRAAYDLLTEFLKAANIIP